jgi:hypothetical protein
MQVISKLQVHLLRLLAWQFDFDDYYLKFAKLSLILGNKFITTLKITY